MTACPKPSPKAKRPRKPMRAKKRSASEYARIYGPGARRQWVQQMPCVVCRKRPCDNAHTANEGKGRKGHYTTVVPLCRYCHRLSHSIGQSTFEALYGVDLTALAALTEQRWQTYAASIPSLTENAK